MDSEDKLRSVISEQVGDDEEKNIKNSSEKAEKTPTENKPVEKAEIADTTKVEDKKEQIEAFSKKVDTKGLSPEKLEEIYEGYNKAYTQKRQKEKEELRVANSRIAELEKKTQVVDGQRKAVPQDLQQAKQEARHDLELGKLNVQEYTDRLIAIGEENARRIAKEEFNSMYTQKADETSQNQALSEFNSSDERFDKRFVDPDSPEFNETNAWMYQEVAGKMAEALDQHVAKTGTSVGFNAKENAKRFIEAFDKRIDSIVSNRVKANTQNATSRAMRFQKSSPGGKTVNSVSEGKKNLRDSIEENMQ